MASISVDDGPWPSGDAVEDPAAEIVTAPRPKEPEGGDLVRRHSLATRLWHWVNAFAVFVMLMSGLMIFNAHPRLYWGRFGANPDADWLDITAGHLRIGPLHIPTLGILGVTPAGGRFVAFPPRATLPSHYDLAGAREIHLAVAWLLVVPGLLYWGWGFTRRHFQRDLAPRRSELTPANLLHDVRDHLRLRFPTGLAALRYNILQKLAYCSVLFVLLPGVDAASATWANSRILCRKP